MTSPLAALLPELDQVERLTAGRLRLAERPFMSTLDVRFDPADRELVGRLEASFGMSWPTAPNRSATVAGRLIVWLAPDEWLVVAPAGSETKLHEQLMAAAAGSWVTATDVSAQRTVIEMDGDACREILMTGCSLDLYAAQCHVGHCAQTMLARAGVILVPTSEHGFLVLVRSSFAEYLAMWLLDASRQIQLDAPAERDIA